MTDLERCDLEIERIYRELDPNKPAWYPAMGHADWEAEKCLIMNEFKPLLRPASSEGIASLPAGASEEYQAFLDRKSQLGSQSGFKPIWIPKSMFDFQASLTEWAIQKGRAALLVDCGMGKTFMQLVWAENVVRKTNKPVLIITPLAVGAQTVREGDKFGIECKKTGDGKVQPGINVTNYERLHYFDPNDFAGVVLDESSILKSFDGKRRSEITEFMRTRPYRLLCTATAAPNDYIELGTSSEALGELGHVDMLGRFFKNDQNTIQPMRHHILGKNFRDPPPMQEKWRFKGHAEIPFYRFVCSWARACRKPSDLGFPDRKFILPKLRETQHLVTALTLADGMLFSVPAIGLKEQREERRRTVAERCEKVAELVDDGQPALVWCHLNDEGDILAQIIPDCVQVSGGDSDDEKEEKFTAFSAGQIRVLATKPKIGAWGLNFQHCAHVTFFPSHSFEQYYQGVRRCYRFGQTRPVQVDIVTTEGEQYVMENLQRKAAQADKMFSSLVAQMNNAQKIKRVNTATLDMEVPAWL